MPDFRVLSGAQMASAEKLSIEAGRDRRDLIDIASSACTSEVVKRWPNKQIIVLCGAGGNGEDGFHIAKRLSAVGRDVQLLAYALSDDVLSQRVVDSRWIGPVLQIDEGHEGEVSALFEGVDDDFVIVDALLGLGCSRPPQGVLSQLISAVNDLNLPVLSVDIPSGLNADMSMSADPHILADVTVTFEALKPVHVLEPVASACGEVVVAPLNLPDDIIDSTGPDLRLNDVSHWRADIPWPGRDTHKYQRGYVITLSGPARKTGAARMSALAALRSGAGVVTLLGEPEALRELAFTSLEVMARSYSSHADYLERVESCDALIVGPAAGVSVETRQCTLSGLRSGKPMVVDADALSVFAEDPRTLHESLHEHAVITPHVGEFERVFPGLMEDASNRIEAVRNAQKRAGCTIVLKGPDTIICSGEDLLRINVHSAPWLATAGSGDVLAGMIGAFLAKGVDAHKAACMAVWMHGEAGVRLGPGMIAGDIIAEIPSILKSLYVHPPADRADRRRKSIRWFS